MDLQKYPIQFIKPMILGENTVLQLRPIHPSDRANADLFKASLSDQSIYDRFFGYIPTANEQLVKRLIDIDYSKEMAIVAELINDPKRVISVARIVPEDETTAEYAIIISDDWQGKGLGGKLTSYMLEVAAKMGYQKLCATILSHNTAMLEILRKLDFELKPEDAQTILAIKHL